MMRTSEELLRLWVEALESGKYPQAQKTLRTKDGFCCLGVACDVSGLGAWIPIAEAVEVIDDKFDDSEELERAYLPESDESTHLYKADDSTQKELELPRAIRRRIGITDEQETALTLLNDGGQSFADIAQQIRQWFPHVFAVDTP